MGKIYFQMKHDTGDKRFGNRLRGKWNYCRGCNGCYQGTRIIRSNARLGGATQGTAFLADVGLSQGCLDIVRPTLKSWEY